MAPLSVDIVRIFDWGHLMGIALGMGLGVVYIFSTSKFVSSGELDSLV